ncbi:MAG: hypothetical protein ACT4PZ_15595 [Panacagrimonas sp.]
MHAHQPLSTLGFSLLHRITYRIGQGVLICWALAAMFAPDTELPSRWELVISAGFVLSMLVLPRPQTPPERRPLRARRDRPLLNRLAFLV